jgi:hypothetical protein
MADSQHIASERHEQQAAHDGREHAGLHAEPEHVAEAERH